MARPKKTGLDYFPFDVDFFSDKKIKRLRASYGVNGVTVYLYLLCEIYRNGYYVEYDDDLILDISDELNISTNALKQILNYLFSRSLLVVKESKLAVPVKVITASSVQRRYQAAKKGAKRDIDVAAEFWVLKNEETESFIKVRPENNFSENNDNFSENNPCKSQNNHTKESKGKKSKEKESKGEESNSAPPLSTFGEFGHINLTDEQYQKLVQQYGETNIKSYIRKMDDWLELNHRTYDNCYVKLRQWLDKDGIKKDNNDGFEAEKYLCFVNDI